MSPAILSDGPLAEALARHRDEFNQRFAGMRRTGAGMDSGAFLRHVAALDGTVRAIARDFPEESDAAAVALFAISVELFETGLLGPAARNTAVAELWQKLFPLIPRILSRDPRRVAAGLTNAVNNLAQISGARPAEWIAFLCATAGSCEDAARLWNAGTIAAWRAGAVQYRTAALELADGLPPAFLAGLIFPAGTAAEKIPAALENLSGNRWLTPVEALAGPNPGRVRMVRWAGEFRGFGGPFLRPPIVGMQGSQLVASDGQCIFSLVADSCGCVFQRVATGALAPSARTGPVQLFHNGNVKWETATAQFFELANYNSAAFDGETLAVTLPDSHHVFLLARG